MTYKVMADMKKVYDDLIIIILYHVRTFRFRFKSEDIHDKLFIFKFVCTIVLLLSVIMIEYSNGRVFCTFSFLRICSRQKLMA